MHGHTNVKLNKYKVFVRRPEGTTM